MIGKALTFAVSGFVVATALLVLSLGTANIGDPMDQPVMNMGLG